MSDIFRQSFLHRHQLSGCSSAGGQIPRRNGLSDGSFKKLLLLRQDNLA